MVASDIAAQVEDSAIDKSFMKDLWNSLSFLFVLNELTLQKHLQGSCTLHVRGYFEEIDLDDFNYLLKLMGRSLSE